VQLPLEHKIQFHRYLNRFKDTKKSIRPIIYNSISDLELEVEAFKTHVSDILTAFKADIDRILAPVLVQVLLASNERNLLCPLPVAEQEASKLVTKAEK
jgi:hypothetical protein